MPRPVHEAKSWLMLGRRRARFRVAAVAIDRERWELVDFLTPAGSERQRNTPVKIFVDSNRTAYDDGYLYLTSDHVLVARLGDGFDALGDAVQGQRFANAALHTARFSYKRDSEYLLLLAWTGDDGDDQALLLELFPGFNSYLMAKELMKRSKRKR